MSGDGIPRVVVTRGRRRREVQIGRHSQRSGRELYETRRPEPIVRGLIPLISKCSRRKGIHLARPQCCNRSVPPEAHPAVSLRHGGRVVSRISHLEYSGWVSPSDLSSAPNLGFLLTWITRRISFSEQPLRVLSPESAWRAQFWAGHFPIFASAKYPISWEPGTQSRPLSPKFC